MVPTPSDTTFNESSPPPWSGSLEIASRARIAAMTGTPRAFAACVGHRARYVAFASAATRSANVVDPAAVVVAAAALAAASSFSLSVRAFSR